MIYLGADHRGYNLKEEIKKSFKLDDIEFKDLGNLNYDENDDYPDFVKKVAGEVLSNPKENKGILLCGTGIGMSIAANKFKGIRAGLCLSGYMAKRAVEEDDINILCLAADITDIGTIKKIIKEWLKARFKDEERYKKRIEKILEIEKLN
jgi:ribose 5-phosphate isomerase B